jgi:2-phospho-L-lactate/phosphoenolpyruvate guanylyltransferase
MTGMPDARWTIIIPVKRLSIGKSRLRGAPADDALVLAIALDTVDAARESDAVERVLVVTADAAIAEAVGRLGAEIVADRPDAGLNPAIALGDTHAGSDRPRAALLADVPALRSAELTDALHKAAGTCTRAYVADHAGTGTTLLIAPAGIELDPHFGPGSAAAHAASGAAALDGDWPSLRLDVDTAADLAAAAHVGLGRHTARVIRAAAQAGRPIAMIDATG